jgi:hypothetical protein
MLLVIIALLWVALLAPMAIRRLRDSRSERSIASFHTEHEVLSRQSYAVAPAHRLSEPDPAPAGPDPRAPRLTVVHDDDTYRTLESRRSWEEWSEDYDYDRQEPEARSEPANRYARAYASTPRDLGEFDRGEPARRARSMRAQRQRMVTGLSLAVLAATTLALVAGSSVLVDLAIVTWVALASYGALALYAVSEGLLDESSLGLDRLRPRRLASVEPLYAGSDDEGDYGDGFGASVIGLRDNAAYDPVSEGWRRQSSRYALG